MNAIQIVDSFLGRRQHLILELIVVSSANIIDQCKRFDKSFIWF